MKRFFNIFLSLVIISLIIILPACSNNDDGDNNSNANEEYYLALGYYSITFDKYSSIIYDNKNNDKVMISDSKIMLPHNSKFSIAFNLNNNSDFKFNNSNYINFSTGKILSTFTDGNKFYDIHDNSITLKNNLEITATFENFKVLGVAIFPITANNETSIPNLSGSFDMPPTDYKDLLYYYSKDSSYESFANDTSQIVSKTTYKTTTTLLQDNKFELNICLETFLDTLSVQSYLILEDNSNNFYFYQKSFDDDFINTPVVFDNLSNPNSNIHKITLSLSYDLTTRDEY